MSDTAATFRELIRLAKVGGAHPAWLKAKASEIVELLLQLEDLRRAADPRKVRTLALVRKVTEADAALRSAGVTNGRVRILANRFDLTSNRINALLRKGCETQPASVVHSDDEHESI
jgi:uncharacterized tellurite resistance protein B-like protein